MTQKQSDPSDRRALSDLHGDCSDIVIFFFGGFFFVFRSDTLEREATDPPDLPEAIFHWPA